MGHVASHGRKNDTVRKGHWVATTDVPQGETETAVNPMPQCWKRNFLTVHYSGCKHFQLYEKCRKMAINVVTVLLVLVEY